MLLMEMNTVTDSVITLADATEEVQTVAENHFTDQCNWSRDQGDLFGLADTEDFEPKQHYISTALRT